MPTRRSLVASRAVLLASLAAAGLPAPAGAADGLVAQQTQPVWNFSNHSMTFVVAKGRPEACGPQCNEWIAAEGEFDLQTPRRLLKLLDQLGERRLPIYFHSPGGYGSAAMQIGRTLRQRSMAAGVARTLRGAESLSALESVGAKCLSACVYALIGATSRTVGPGAAIGVHKPGQVVGRGEERFTTEHVPPIKLSVRMREVAQYIHDMGLDEGLYDALHATPYYRMRYLTRDEIVRFGVESRAASEAR
jgi:hypothetical protein